MSMEQILETIEENRIKIKEMSFENMNFHEIEEEIKKQRQEHKDKPLYECDEFKIIYSKNYPDFSEYFLIITEPTGKEIKLKLPRGTLSDFVKTEKDKLDEKITKYENDHSSLTGIKNLLEFQGVTIEQFYKAMAEAYIEDERRIQLGVKFQDFEDCPYI